MKKLELTVKEEAIKLSKILGYDTNKPAPPVIREYIKNRNIGFTHLDTIEILKINYEEIKKYKGEKNV